MGVGDRGQKWAARALGNIIVGRISEGAAYPCRVSWQDLTSTSNYQEETRGLTCSWAEDIADGGALRCSCRARTSKFIGRLIATFTVAISGLDLNSEMYQRS